MRSIKNSIRTLFSLSLGAAALCLCIHCGHGGGDSNPGNGITGHAYVANADSLSLYTVSATGALVPMAPPTISLPSPWAIAFDPSSKYAYVTSSGANGVDHLVSQYAIGTDGGLTAVPSGTVQTGSTPFSITIASNSSGSHAYVVNVIDQNISQYSIGLGGTLAPMTPPQIIVTRTGGPGPLVVDPSGRFAYVSISNGTIAQFAIGPTNGALSPMTPPAVTTGGSTGSASAAISGNYLYALDDAAGNVMKFAIDQTTGALSGPVTFVAGTLPVGIAVDPTGKYAYVLNMNSADISQYTVGKTDGGLTPMAHPTVAVGIAGTDSPYSIAIDPSGKCVYVVTELGSSSTVFQYSIAANGELQPMSPPTVAAGSYAGAIAILGR